MDLTALALTLGSLLVLSGLFSGAETALFSIPPLRLREMETSPRSSDRMVSRTMAKPRRILVTILLGNMLVNIMAGSVGAAAAIRLLGSAAAGLPVAIGVMTFFVLVVGEITPKTVAVRHAETVSRLLVRPLLWLGRILFPVQWVLERITDLVLGHEPTTDARVAFDEVLTMLDLAHSDGEVETAERELIEGVFELGTSPVGEVMTPRTEILSLPPDLSVVKARVQVRRAAYSKIPVAGERPDEMVGVVTARDLLLAEDAATVGSLAQEVPYVPEVKPALALLEEFRQTGERVAFVIDEHGHLTGLVTLTDLLEEISGEMIERGDLHKVLYRRVGRSKIMIPGRMEVRFFNEEFGTNLKTESAETMAGLLLERIGRIPGVGETFSFEDCRLRVLRAEPNRVLALEVQLPESGAQNEDSRE